MRRIALCGVLFLAACATRPENIDAAYTSAVPYSPLSCEQLASERNKLNAAYDIAARRQNRTRTVDNISVAIIGLPAASLSGRGRAQEIAQIKGQLNAVNSEYERKGCAVGPKEPATPS